MPYAPGICEVCGKKTSRRIFTRCKPCSNTSRSGELHPNWKGGNPSHRKKGVCIDCGGPTSSKFFARCRPCFYLSISGENNYQWDRPPTSEMQGRDQALRRKKLDICEECKTSPAVDRHHKDNNPLNNDPDNLMGLCRRCHMKLDGRLEQLPKRDSRINNQRKW